MFNPHTHTIAVKNNKLSFNHVAKIYKFKLIESTYS